MGCVQSGRGRAARAAGAEGPSGTADRKLLPRNKQLRILEPAARVHSSESLKIRIIWRRVSVFGNRRDSIQSTKSTTSATSLPGPSKPVPERGPLEAKPPPLDGCPAADSEGK